MNRYFYEKSVCAALLLFLTLHTILHSYDTGHFYRAQYLWPEPRFERPWMSSFELSFAQGTTKKGYNSHGKKVSLLDIDGIYNIPALIENYPNTTNPYNALLEDLNNLPSNGTFGMLSYHGTFHIIEGMIHGYQNLNHGFFIHGHIPIRYFLTDEIKYVDLSPEDGFPNKNTPEWQLFLKNSTAIFNSYGIYPQKNVAYGMGDFSLLLGWTKNYQNTTTWDYVDIAAQWGVLFPTGKRASLKNPFSIPLGYDGFWGCPILFDAACGIFDWLTFGCHLSALFLFNKDKHYRIKVAENQSGLIKLNSTDCCVDPGTVWSIDLYTKADHLVRGLSLFIGYSYTMRERTVLQSALNFESYIRIINTDPFYDGWDMHTIHCILEYDFAQHPDDKMPRVGIIGNFPVAGHKIYNTIMSGLYLGIDLNWRF